MAVVPKGRQRRGECQRAAAQAPLGHAVDAQPGQPALGESAAERPESQRQQHQHTGEKALPGRPDRGPGEVHLIDEKLQALAVIRLRRHQGRPEVGAQDAVGAQRQFAFEQRAANPRDLRDQLGGALLERGKALERGIDLVFLFAEHCPLRGDFRLFGGNLRIRRRAEHPQLHRQLCLLRQQRRRQPIDVQNERLYPVLRAFELVVVVGGGNLLLQPVEAQLQGLQITL
ncbi:hypothetical protein PMI25_004109 [Pseudomonas sp. GM30]|nr:hypothetical protein PMI25_004109 [Pseudomonas sp. GM30]